MAGPINHIILGERVYKSVFQNSPEGDFFVGTMFPDIRYLGTVLREETHIDDLKISDIKDGSRFVVGMKVHSYVDYVREKHATMNNLYKRAMEMVRANQCLKFLEDELFYDQYERWEEIVRCFGDVLDEEVRFGIDKEDVGRWHRALQKYFSKKPSDESRSRLMIDLGFSRSTVEKINQNVAELGSDDEFLDKIRKTYKDVEKEISGYRK